MENSICTNVHQNSKNKTKKYEDGSFDGFKEEDFDEGDDDSVRDIYWMYMLSRDDTNDLFVKN